jgi:RHS repeat-associated protein
VILVLYRLIRSRLDSLVIGVKGLFMSLLSCSPVRVRTAAVAVATGLVFASAPLAHAAAAKTARHPAPKLAKLTPARDVGKLGFRQVHVPNEAASRYRPAGTTWPSASSASLNLAAAAAPPLAPGASAEPLATMLFGGYGAASGLASAAGTPVQAGRLGGPAEEPSTVAVTVLRHKTAVAAGVRGVVFTAKSETDRGGRVRVALDYASFADISGGNYGLDLGLEVLPQCALSTPELARCRAGKPLDSVNDAAAQTVSAVVSVPADAASGPLVVAAADAYSDGGGDAGTYNATSLKPSGTWTAGGSEGSFTYSYPMAVPPAAGGLEPQVGLSYDSGEVDGQTASTQAQASWAGDGWTTPQSYIEQSFVPCQDDPEGSAAPDATQDDCYNGPILTLSLNGSSTPLVCPVPFSYTANSTCYASSDNGEVVTHHVSSGNGQGTKFTDYWTVTTRDGTTYSFGLNHLPGWASGDPATNSVDSVPVFSAHSGDPCYSSTWSSSVCTMAYRWNLDYVKDALGNAMAYYYTQSSNAYAENDNTSSAVSYIRDSYLNKIAYGFTDGNAYSGSAPDEVLFTTGDRCFSGTCDPLNSTNAPNWPDVPYTQDYCASGASCQVTAPSFWSTVRLASVTAEQWNGSKYVMADSWALAQHFPTTGDGTSPALWLDSVTRTGSDTTAGGSAVTLPPVQFAGTEYQNRVNPGNYPALYRYRITGITSETGSVTSVAYELTNPCNPSSYPTPSANTSSCFPVYWQQFEPPAAPDWFNKYAVASVSVSDPAGGSPGTYTSYSYSGAAWHYDDNELVQPKYRTYGQWRGYQAVKTYNGTGTDAQTESETTYYQGMSDDNDSTDVTVEDSQGNNHEDSDQLAGEALETTAYTYAGGPVDHSEIFSYWVSPAVYSRTRSGLPALTANFTGEVEDWTRQALTDSSTTTWRTTETDTSYDTTLSDATAGLPLFIYAHGDLSDPASDPHQQTCTSITYAAANTSENLAGLPAETEVVALPCGGSNPGGSSMPGSGQVNALSKPSGIAQSNVVSDTRTYYDDPSLATTWPQPASPAWPQAAPANSDVSVVRMATGYNSSTGAFSYETSSADVYNSYGEVTSSYDADGGWNGSTYTPTTTAYTMANGSVTQVKVTNPLGQSSTTVIDPMRGLPVTVTDANGIATNLHYDGLGRLIDLWEYGRATSSAANVIYSYAVSNTGPTVTTTESLDDAGGYVTSTSLYDSLLRLRQTQTPTPQGGMLVSDDFYDSRGWEWKTNTNWWDSTANPGSTIVTVPDSQVPNQTVTQYDGLGRPVIVTSYNDSQVKSTSYTLYTGDKVTTVPPTGGTTTTTASDALGRTTELDSYTAPPTVATGTNAGGFATVTLTGGTSQATDYSYETRGWLSGITDVSTGEQWTRTYNSLGQAITTTSPNGGTTSMAYDADGNLTSTTDALGHTITYTYDAVNRVTGEYDGTSTSAPQISSWTYDNSNDAVAGMTDPIGELTTATSTYDGNTYTFQQTGFNNFGEPLGEKVTLPAAEGNLAGTYTLAQTYTATTGLPYRTYYPASPDGGTLPAETVTTGYIPGFDLPSSLSSNLAAYAQSTTWNAFSQPAQEEVGSTTDNAYLTNTFDPHTGALTNAQVTNTAVSSTPFDSTSYTYDPSGNVTSETDVRDGSETELQCFNYDGLDRLTAAWTTNGTYPCSAGPSTGTGGTVGDGISGSAYWTSWSYNALGDQQTQTQHSVTGGTNTVTSYTYNNGNGTGTGQPDTLTSAVTTGPGAGTSTYTYDADGNTLTRDLPGGNQSLSWYDNGLLKSDTTSAGTTSYVYDPSGNLLLQKDPGRTTLFIFGEQIVLNTSTGAVTGTRFLSLPGGGDVVRTGSGTSYWFEFTNVQGTGTMVLDDTAANPQWRQETPFGAARGDPPASWPDTSGILGKPTDSNTGLSILGSRQYDSTTGRFISVDPVIEPDSPQQLNGYTYSGDNPVTYSDPSGLMLCDGDICGSVQYIEAAEDRIQHQEVAAYNSLANTIENNQAGACDYTYRCLETITANFSKPAYVYRQVTGYIQVAQQEALAAARAQAAAEEARQRAAQSSGWGWLGTVALAVAGVALTVVNVMQLGLDPLTDGAEIADVAALTADVAAEGAEEVVTTIVEDGADSEAEAIAESAEPVEAPEDTATDDEASSTDEESGLSRPQRMGIGAAAGAIGNSAAGFIQHKSAKQIALDGLIGAVTGAAGSVPGGPGAANTVASVFAGGASAAASGYGSQVVNNWSFDPSKINVSAILIDGVVGAGTAGAGTFAVAHGMDDLDANLGTGAASILEAEICAGLGRC